jgi:FixJ family two-component response regulator
MREAGRDLFETAGWAVCDYHSAEDFLSGPRPTGDACLVIDVMLPGMSGLALLLVLRAEGAQVPAIMLTGRGDAATAVAALKAGAADFLEKPADRTNLLASVGQALDQARADRARALARDRARARFETLTLREREVMQKVLDGIPNKNIAADLGINQRTVENHRARVMQKTKARSLPALVQLFLEAGRTD